MKFVLDGEKLQGEFALVRTRKDEKSWLLLKKKDRFATTEDILRKDLSVVSGQTVEDIAEADPKKPSRQEETDQVHLREVIEGKDLKDTPVRPMPRNIKPMLTTLIEKPFDDPDWIFEVKWDGYRAITVIRDGTVSSKFPKPDLVKSRSSLPSWTRSGNSNLRLFWTAKLSWLMIGDTPTSRCFRITIKPEAAIWSTMFLIFSTSRDMI